MSEGKVVPLAAAVAAHVPDGATVFLGGFGHAIPFAAAHELIRQDRRGLAVCRSGADIVVDQLIGAGAVRRLVFGWVGNPGVGLAHAFSRAVAAGSIEYEEWTNYSLMLRLEAGAAGVPFLPTEVLRDGDVPGGSCDVRTVVCPFTGRELAAVPALVPDVAIVHAQRASADGDVQLWGVVGDTVAGALASRHIIVSVEEVVPASELAAMPDRTVIPGYRVDAVSVVPGGARPSWVDGAYGRDDDAYRAWDAVSRDAAALDAWVEQVRRSPSP